MTIKLDIQDIQYINVFSSIARVSATDCFSYNNNIIFVVKPGLVLRAVGEGGINIRRIGERINRRIKVVAMPVTASDYDVGKFVLALVYPIRFKKLTRNEGEVKIEAGGQQAKAMLIGRNGTRLDELRIILRKYFKISNLRIV